MTNQKEDAGTPAAKYLNSRSNRQGSQAMNALDHLAFALMTDAGETVADALAALATLREQFVDWNEIRVARGQEVSRALGNLDSHEDTALRIITEYNAFFEKRGALSFDFLAAGKVAEGRKLMHQYIPKLKKGAVGLLLFEFCPGATLPISDEALKVAKKEGLVGKSGDRNQLARILAETLPMESVAKVAQYLELDATSHPYGEPVKPGAVKTVKPSAKKSPRGKGGAKD